MNVKRKKYISITGFLLFPLLHFYLLEAYTHNAFSELRPWSLLFNILLFEIVAVILFFLFRNLKWALWIEGSCAMVFGLINYYVYTFRSLPLVPWDILSIGTAFRVADNYNFMPTARVVVVVIAFLFVLFLERFCELKLEKLSWYQSLLAALALMAGLVGFCSVLQQEDFQNKHKMYNKLFTPVRMWQVNGSALTLVMELPYLSIDKPKGYEKEEAQKQLLSYETGKEAESNEVGIHGVKPNIIAIMDEAFSDLAVLGDFQTNEDYMPYLHSIWEGSKNTITGYLHVSVCGGNTANTEFEFLTGNTMAFLPQGSIPYQQYVKKEIPALPSYLKEIGYTTHAMHPYPAGGWNRDSVYPLLGFEQMEFIEDYNNAGYIRNYISDKSCFDKIIQTYEKKEAGKPLFVFNVTMQNHGSYGDRYENFNPNITVDGVSSYPLSSYLSLIQRTDNALEGLISYFEDVKEPTMIVFFGDHQPNDTVAEPILRLNGMSYRNLSEEETQLRYQVPYLIWTNYEMETINHADMSANYLGQKVLEAAGLEMPAYQSFLEEFFKSYPVVSALERQKSDAASMDISDYEKLQYYQLFDIQN